MKINFKGFVATVVSTMAISMSVYADRDVKVEVKDMPARAQEFLTAYFQNMPIQTVLTDEARAEFEVQFPMGLDVEFDKNGNWTKVERDMKRWMEEMQKMRGNWQGGQGRMPSGEVGNKDSKDNKDNKNAKRQQGNRPRGQFFGNEMAGAPNRMNEQPRSSAQQRGPRGQMGQGQGPRGQMGQGQRPGFFMMESLLNEQIKSYMAENYPRMMITVIERYSNGYLLTVATGFNTASDLIFTLDGKFIKKTDKTIQR